MKRIDKIDFHIISPVYNEEKKLNFILQKAKDIGYLNKITFVNDASTDNTLEILKAWYRKEGLQFVNLEVNQKKEGAIRSVLELMNENGTLPDKIITLDSDSFLIPRNPIESFDTAINKAAIYMDQMNLVGMTFNMLPITCTNSTFLEKIQYPEYTGLWFWHRLSAKQNKLWVLNGPGVIFNSKVLMDSLRNMPLDFETGDFLITVDFMKKNHPIGYYEQLQLYTSVPSTPTDLFKQRRRWERGTLKVLSWNLAFYLKETINLSLIGVQLLVYLWLYFGWLLFVFNNEIDKQTLTEGFLLLISFWLSINLCVNLLNKSVWRYANISKIMFYTPVWLAVWPFIIMPARFAGLLDFFKHYLHRIFAGQKIVSNNKDHQVTFYQENDL